MANLKSQLLELTRKKYVDQAIWYLNGFWKEGAENEAENIWIYCQKFMELDSKKKEGNELDEFWSHKFLESLGETLTIIQLREKLRKIDLDANGKMALLEYLMFKYSKGISEVLNAPQGGNEEELKKAQEELTAVQNALDTLTKKLEEQRIAEESVKRAEEELKSAVKELQQQEDSYKMKIEDLTRKSTQETSIVAKNKASQELAQLKQENPLPLRKAKITQEAALRKVEKQRKEVEEATRSVEAAVQKTEEKMLEAQNYLQEIKRKGGVSYGTIFWLERELKEAKKYLPKSKQ